MDGPNFTRCLSCVFWHQFFKGDDEAMGRCRNEKSEHFDKRTPLSAGCSSYEEER